MRSSCMFRIGQLFVTSLNLVSKLRLSLKVPLVDPASLSPLHFTSLLDAPSPAKLSIHLNSHLKDRMMVSKIRTLNFKLYRPPKNPIVGIFPPIIVITINKTRSANYPTFMTSYIQIPEAKKMIGTSPWSIRLRCSRTTIIPITLLAGNR